jgi:AAA domain
MMLPTYDAWVLVRLASDQPLNGELAAMSEAWRPLAERLAATPPEGRRSGLEWFLAGQPDPNAIILAMAQVDPMGPAPAPTSASIVRSAHLGDLTSCQNAGQFIWPNWIVCAHFTLLSSDPKIGKTHFALDLARRLWFGLPWPDGQTPTLPAGTATLWVCGDRHQDELESAPQHSVCPLKRFG